MLLTSETFPFSPPILCSRHPLPRSGSGNGRRRVRVELRGRALTRIGYLFLSFLEDAWGEPSRTFVRTGVDPTFRFYWGQPSCHGQVHKVFLVVHPNRRDTRHHMGVGSARDGGGSCGVLPLVYQCFCSPHDLSHSRLATIRTRGDWTDRISRLVRRRSLALYRWTASCLSACDPRSGIRARDSRHVIGNHHWTCDKRGTKAIEPLEELVRTWPRSSWSQYGVSGGYRPVNGVRAT